MIAADRCALESITKSPEDILVSLGLPLSLLDTYASIDLKRIRVFQCKNPMEEHELAILSGFIPEVYLSRIKAGNFAAYAFLDKSLVILPADNLSYNQIVHVMTGWPSGFIQSEFSNEKLPLLNAYILLHELGHFMYGGTFGLTDVKACNIEKKCDADALYALYRHSLPHMPDVYQEVIYMRAIAALSGSIIAKKLGVSLDGEHFYDHAVILQSLDSSLNLERIIEEYRELQDLVGANFWPAGFFPSEQCLSLNVYAAAVRTSGDPTLSDSKRTALSLYLKASEYFCPVFTTVIKYYIQKNTPMLLGNPSPASPELSL